MMPLCCLSIILRHTLAMLVHCSYVELGAGITLIGGSAKPLYGFGIVPPDPFAVGVDAAYSDLRECIALLGQRAVRLQSTFVISSLQCCVSILERAGDACCRKT